MFTFSPSFVPTIHLARLDSRLAKLWSQIGEFVAAIAGVVIATSVMGSQAILAENDPGELRINLVAVSQESIGYKTNNGIEISGQTVGSFDIPHMVLYRNDTPVDPEERTINVSPGSMSLPVVPTCSWM